MAVFTRFGKDFNAEQHELKMLSRTVTEVEYLLILLVILYVVIPGTTFDNKFAIIMSSVCMASFIIFFHYIIRRTLNKFTLSIEAIVMTAYITFVVWHTGRTESPLLGLYVIVIIYSALMLGKVTTLLLVALTTSFLLYFDYSIYSLELFSWTRSDEIMEKVIMLYTLLLVSYLTITISTHIHATKEEIKLLSERDDLTDLWNMRAFIRALEHEFMRAQRYNRIFCLMMVDADDLKMVNDKFGHLWGDKFICLVADILRREARSTDIIARYGGDEFVLMLPETDVKSACDFAERVRTCVEQATLITDDGTKITSSISVGVACYPQHCQDLDSLIEMSDHAMYLSKRQGKNQVTIAT